MKAVKVDRIGNVLIEESKELKVWVDVWAEGGELLTDWNKYIFHLTCSKDLEIKAFQEDNDNCNEAMSIAISFYESVFMTIAETKELKELGKTLFNGDMLKVFTPEQEQSNDYKRYNVLVLKKMNFLKQL